MATEVTYEARRTNWSCLASGEMPKGKVWWLRLGAHEGTSSGEAGSYGSSRWRKGSGMGRCVDRDGRASLRSTICVATELAMV